VIEIGQTGGPSLRSKGGVSDFGLPFSSAKIKCEKPTLCVTQRMGDPPVLGFGEAQARYFRLSPDSSTRTRPTRFFFVARS